MAKKRDLDPRRSERTRATKETEVTVLLELDGTGVALADTGLPFFDHMLGQLGKHGGLNLDVKSHGDLEVDAHHTVEDTGIVLGESLAEALVEVALDLSGRPYLHYDVALGDTAPLGSPPFEVQLAEEFWRAFAHAASLTLHIELRHGRNPHHVLEASFKGVGRALRDAVRVESKGIPSTKGQL